MPFRRTAALLLTAAVLAIGLGACSSDHGTQPHETDSAASTPDPRAADIAFAQLMIPHHQQAVEMSELALDPKAQASAAVRAFATQIKAAQDPEIEQMQGWLQEWGAPSAMPTDSHDSHEMGGITEHGMMTEADLAALAAASGADFDRRWLELMIDHHEGAIEMAEQVKSRSDDPAVLRLANAIITNQLEEIDEMERALT